MSSSALAVLHTFHRQLQQSTQAGIRHFHGQANPAIASYASRFQKSLPRNFRRCSPQYLIEQIQYTDILLFGDFHTLADSQKAFFEVLRQTYDQNPTRPITVALEIFAGSDQTHIDDYLSGQMPEEYFLKRIDYHKKWGFPWENYKPMIDFCVRHKLPILGINQHLNSKDRLAKRDAFAAQVIASVQEKDPSALVLCLIGEYHLADEHLPAYLKPKKVLRVVNNMDEYSLAALSEPIQSFEALEMSSNFFCVLNTTPWLKWQTLAMWEELHGISEDAFYGGERDAYTVEEYDLEYQLLFILKAVNDHLDLGISPNKLSFDIYLKPDRATFSHLRNKFSLTRQTIQTAERKLNQDGFCYIPKSKAILLLDFSMHHLTEAAGYILLDCMNEPLAKSQTFIDRVRYQLAGSVCALLMNPRRSIYTVERVASEWKKLQRKRLVGESRKYRDAFKIVRGFHDEAYRSLAKVSKSIEDDDKSCNFLVSRILGETLAHQLFQLFIRGDAQASKKGLKALFENDVLTILECLQKEPEGIREAS